jgi:hypothetical protein
MRFQLKLPAEMSYRIYTLSGREISRHSEFLGAGSHAMQVTTAKLARGIYLVSCKAGNESMRWRLVVDK